VEVAEDLPGGEWRRIRRADCYRHILVNGEVTFVDGKEDRRHTGPAIAPRPGLITRFSLPYKGTGPPGPFGRGWAEEVKRHKWERGISLSVTSVAT
jgi:hypothetical protein